MKGQDTIRDTNSGLIGNDLPTTLKQNHKRIYCE